MLFTPIRVVCQNTLNIALKMGKSEYRMRHTLSIGTKVSAARAKLGIIVSQSKLFEELSQKLVTIQMNQKDFVAYLEKIGVIVKDEDGKTSTRCENQVKELVRFYEHGKGNDLQSVKGTAWAAFNAVAEYVDYSRGTDANRDESLLFGSGAALKQTAWDAVVSKI